MVWQTTTNENKRIKAALLESKHKPDQFYDHSFIEHHKLLLDD